MVTDPEAVARIEVLDSKTPNEDPISHCEVKLMDLLRPPEQVHDLFFNNIPAGKIFFNSEFSYKKLDMEYVPLGR